MLSEFKERRGYDLTPYLPTISMPSYWRGAADIDETSNYEFEGVGYQIRLDVYKTMTELYTENHVSVFRDWAHSHNMTLRYQGSYNAQFEICLLYTSNGCFYMKVITSQLCGNKIIFISPCNCYHNIRLMCFCFF